MAAPVVRPKGEQASGRPALARATEGWADGVRPENVSAFRPIEVAIVGAGPYGLSVACFLRRRGVSFRIFGEVMRTWRQMPGGIYLKSPDYGTSVYSPERGFGFVEYCRSRGLRSKELCEISTFAEYVEWVQRRLVPEVEKVQVCELAREPNGFRLGLSTGEVVSARRVVVATGLANYQRLPEVFTELPTELVSHTALSLDHSAFKERRVAVVGAGQSALEAAALLHEGGAQVTLLVRGNGAYFAPPPGPRPLRHKLLYPSSVLGPGRLNFFLQHVPMGAHYLPEKRRVPLTRRHLGPWGTWWLRDRIEGKLSVQARTVVEAASRAAGGLQLRLRDPGGETRKLVVDHVVCGTGYEVDVDRLPFLDPPLAASLRRVERAPALNRHFESSESGLYFVGPAAAFSFGSLLRFVAGAAYAAPTVAAHVAHRSRRSAARAHSPAG
jgi:FAD-dependent urate hydroxylase